MATTEPPGRLGYRERLADHQGLDEEALMVLYDEYGNRRRFEVLGGRLVEKPILERTQRETVSDHAALRLPPELA